MLIVYPIVTPMQYRVELSTHLNLFIVTSDREYSAQIKDWMHNQSFTVIAYDGWTDQFFFECISHVMLLKLTFDDILIYVAGDVVAQKTKIPHLYEKLIGSNIIRLG